MPQKIVFMCRSCGKYFYASTADDLYEGFDLIRDETIDYRTDSNGDGISDYYAKLIFEGKLRLQNGSNEMFMIGADIYCDPDIDGDGLLNGEELVIIEVGDRAMIRMVSDPFLKDSDFDGYPDNIDRRPLQRDSFSDDVSDFMTLINHGLYQYSIEADNYYNDFWLQIGTGLYTAVSFTNLQQEYTMQMVNFFIDTANEDHINNAAMAELERAIKNATYDAIGEIASHVEVIDSETLSATELAARITAGREIVLWKTRLTEAMSARNINAYQSWLTRYASEYLAGITLEDGRRIDLPPFRMEKKGIPEKLVKDVGMIVGGAGSDFIDLVNVPNFVSYGFIAFDAYDLYRDVSLMWKAAEYIALDNANKGVFSQNADLLRELRINGNHRFTRSAARFVLDSMALNFWEVMVQTQRHTFIVGSGIALDILLVSAPPAYAIVEATKLLFDLCDFLFGWGDKVVGRAGIICLSDMTEAATKFVNDFYLTDSWDVFGRHLENLINLRISGEKRFIDVFPSRSAERAVAQNNITTVRQIANKMGLFALP